jgi:hypothetical protein
MKTARNVPPSTKCGLKLGSIPKAVSPLVCFLLQEKQLDQIQAVTRSSSPSPHSIYQQNLLWNKLIIALERS